MADSKKAFLRVCSGQINKCFTGDPLELGAFINSIELLQEMATNEETNLLFKIVKSKVSDKALYYVKNTTTLEALIEALTRRFQPLS